MQGTLDGLQQLVKQHAAQPSAPMACVSFAVTPDLPSILSGTLAGVLQHSDYGLQPLAHQTRLLLPSLLAADLRAGHVLSVLMDCPTSQDVSTIIALNMVKR